MLSKFVKYIFGIINPRRFWNYEYEEGNWDYLKGLEESGRYGLISSLCIYFEGYNHILDVGCGEGILLDYLRNDCFESYTGIDISNRAIRAASKKESDSAEFVRCKVENIEVHDDFDIVIFNEVLYYLGDPINTVKKIKKNVGKDGVVIISMYSSIISKILWVYIGNTYEEKYSFMIRNSDGDRWDIKVY